MLCAAAADRIIGLIFPTACLSRTITSRWPEVSRPVLERAHRNRRGSQPIEVEVRTLAELEEALKHGAEAILLDNMSVEHGERSRRSLCSRQNGTYPLNAPVESAWRMCELTHRPAWISFPSVR